MSPADWLLIVSILVLSQCLTAIVIWRRGRRIERQLRQIASRRPESLGDIPTSMLVTSLSRLEQRLTRLESSVKDKPAQSPGTPAGDRSYDLAQRLARQGASAEQITEACGIGLQEAELLLRLHAPS